MRWVTQIFTPLSIYLFINISCLTTSADSHRFAIKHSESLQFHKLRPKIKPLPQKVLPGKFKIEFISFSISSRPHPVVQFLSSRIIISNTIVQSRITFLNQIRIKWLAISFLIPHHLLQSGNNAFQVLSVSEYSD